MSDRTIQGVLGFLVLFDVTLVIWAWAFPDLWFSVFHGVGYDDPEGFLPRCAANWAAFALWQAVAFVRWRREAFWLAVVAGVRLSDIFTDLTYSIAARDTTWFALATLPPMSLVNLLLGVYLLRAYRARRSAAPS